MKFSGPVFRNLLAKKFNAFLSHNFMPAAMIRGKIKPVIKNVSSSKCDSTNYRPVIISDNLLKVFEYCLIPTLIKHWPIHCEQFGFRSGSSCLSAVTVLRETFFCYVSE